MSNERITETDANTDGIFIPEVDEQDVEPEDMTDDRDHYFSNRDENSWERNYWGD